MNTRTYLPSWRDGHYTKSVSANKKFGGGVINELSHELDLMLFCLVGQSSFCKNI